MDYPEYCVTLLNTLRKVQMLRRKIGNRSYWTVAFIFSTRSLGGPARLKLFCSLSHLRRRFSFIYYRSSVGLVGVSLVPEGPRRSLTSLVSPLKSAHHPFEWKIQIHFCHHDSTRQRGNADDHATTLYRFFFELSHVNDRPSEAQGIPPHTPKRRLNLHPLN